MKCWFQGLALALGVLLGAAREASGAMTNAERASALLASAKRHLAQGSHEQRQFGLTELQDAARLDPTRSDIGLVLGRTYLTADLLSQARSVAQRLIEIDTCNAAAWLLKGEVWRRY